MTEASASVCLILATAQNEAHWSKRDRVVFYLEQIWRNKNSLHAFKVEFMPTPLRLGKCEIIFFPFNVFH